MQAIITDFAFLLSLLHCIGESYSLHVYQICHVFMHASHIKNIQVQSILIRTKFDIALCTAKCHGARLKVGVSRFSMHFLQAAISVADYS